METYNNNEEKNQHISLPFQLLHTSMTVPTNISSSADYEIQKQLELKQKDDQRPFCKNKHNYFKETNVK